MMPFAVFRIGRYERQANLLQSFPQHEPPSSGIYIIICYHKNIQFLPSHRWNKVSASGSKKDSQFPASSTSSASKIHLPFPAISPSRHPFTAIEFPEMTAARASRKTLLHGRRCNIPEFQPATQPGPLPLALLPCPPAGVPSPPRRPACIGSKRVHRDNSPDTPDSPREHPRRAYFPPWTGASQVGGGRWSYG